MKYLLVLSSFFHLILIVTVRKILCCSVGFCEAWHLMNAYKEHSMENYLFSKGLKIGKTICLFESFYSFKHIQSSPNISLCVFQNTLLVVLLLKLPPLNCGSIFKKICIPWFIILVFKWPAELIQQIWTNFILIWQGFHLTIVVLQF